MPVIAGGGLGLKLGGHVLVVDNHPVSREGLSMAARMALPGSSMISAGSVMEAVLTTQRAFEWRMVLLELDLPDARGYSGLLSLQNEISRTPIVIVTGQVEGRFVAAAKALGAAGYIYKTAPVDTIASYLRRIDTGQVVFPEAGPAPQKIVAARQRINSLSTSQHAVLMALTSGSSNKEIGHTLSLSEATVKAHLTAVFRKLGVTNRAQALLAIQPLVGPVT